MLQDFFDKLDAMPLEQFVAWVVLIYVVIVILTRLSDLKQWKP